MKHVIAWAQAFALSIGGLGLFFVAFLDASVLSLPEVNDILIVYMVTKSPSFLVYYAAMATAGSVGGSLIVYYLGRKGGEALLRKQFSREQVDRMQARFTRYGMAAVVVPAMLPPPVPLKLFVLGAGVAGMSAGKFAWAIGIGRGVRYLAEGILAYYYGAVAFEYIKRHGSGVALWGAVISAAVLGAYYWRRAAHGRGMMRPPVTSPHLSVVIPIRNESASIPELYRQLTSALEPWGRPYEILLIDDGSTDDSFERLAAIQAGDARVRLIRFRRNFGQTAAFAAGFAHARGGLIVTSDGDLQNDPADIPALVALVEQGADIAAGWRKDRKDPFLTRRLPSMIANWIISHATGVKLHDYGCSLKVFRAEVVKPLRLYGEMHRFLPAIASELGVKIVEQVVNHRPRQYGQSKYGLGRTVRVVLDLMTVKFLLSYATRPLQIFGLLGIIMGGLGGVLIGWLSYLRLFAYQSIANRPLLLFGILLVFTGVQLITLGLLAEMQVRTYHESQGKPTYVIREIRETPPA